MTIPIQCTPESGWSFFVFLYHLPSLIGIGTASISINEHVGLKKGNSCTAHSC